MRYYLFTGDSLTGYAENTVSGKVKQTLEELRNRQRTFARIDDTKYTRAIGVIDGGKR